MVTVPPHAAQTHILPKARLSHLDIAGESPANFRGKSAMSGEPIPDSEDDDSDYVQGTVFNRELSRRCTTSRRGYCNLHSTD